MTQGDNTILTLKAKHEMTRHDSHPYYINNLPTTMTEFLSSLTFPNVGTGAAEMVAQGRRSTWSVWLKSSEDKR